MKEFDFNKKDRLINLELLKYNLNSILYFVDMIYIINLKERKDRFKNVLDQLTKFKVKNYKIYPGLKPNFNEINPMLYLNYSTHLSINHRKYIIGATGCKLSHRNIIKEAMDMNYNYIMILEDDFQFMPNFLSNLNNFIRKVNNLKWDMIYLGGNFKSKPIKDFCSNTKEKNIYKCKNISCTHSYILRKNLFSKIYEELNTYPGEIDDYYVNNIQPFYSTYIYDPILITQTKSYSDILDKETNYFNL